MFFFVTRPKLVSNYLLNQPFTCYRMNNRKAHWENGPQLEQLRQLLNDRKERVRKSLLPKIKPTTRRIPLAKTKTPPQNNYTSPNLEPANQETKTADQLARDFASHTKPTHTSKALTINSAITTRMGLPSHVQRKVKELKGPTSTYPKFTL